MSDHGLVCPPEWTLECDWTAAGAAEHADRLFAAPPHPHLRRRGIRRDGLRGDERRPPARAASPRDVSVIGIDDHVHAEIFDLTTVRQDVEAQGRRAGQIMLDALRGRGGDDIVDDVLDVELVVRGSTAPPRAAAGEPAPAAGRRSEPLVPGDVA